MKITVIRKISTLLLAVTLAFSIAACNNNYTAKQTSTSSPESSQPIATATAASEPSQSTTITDRSGVTLTIPKNVDRIISMAPSITQTIVHLGLGDRLIAVDKYSIALPGVPKNVPVFDIMNPDAESITLLKPDIIFATGMSKAKDNDPFKPITDLGVLVTYIPSSASIAGIKEDISFIAQITNSGDKAENIIKEMESEISSIIDKISGQSTTQKVYFEIASAPTIYSFGKNTFLNEIVELLGAENILADQEGWVSVSEETIIDKNPDVIFTNVDYVENPVGEILGRNGWNVIKAVENESVYLISKNPSSLPNENVIIAIKEMAKILYPDLFD